MTSNPISWRAFSAAPHRMMFFAGATQGVLTILWWLIDLLGRYTSLYAPLAWPVTPSWAHGFMMIYGFFPFFIFGFLMTVYPNWMNGERVPPRRYLPAFALLAGGQALFYGGLMFGQNILPVAVLVVLAGWTVAYYALLRVLFGAVHPDKLHPAITAVALGLAWSGIAAYALWLAGAGDGFAVFALKAGVWWFLVPVFFTVSHRMIPFFSSRIIDGYHIVRPKWALWTVLGCSAAHGLLEMLGADRWLWLVDIPFVAASLHLTWHWRIFESFKARLLAVLHLGFAWLSLALALSALQSLAALAGYPILGYAPLHALGVGFFASMVLAMATRVTLGHSGRDLVADRVTWILFLAFQAAALARICGDLPLPGHTHFYLLAAVLWLACFIPWWVKYAPVYWRAREDGGAG